jgi:hypothetical protein
MRFAADREAAAADRSNEMTGSGFLANRATLVADGGPGEGDLARPGRRHQQYVV